MQPLDGATIAWVKSMYRRRLLSRILDKIDYLRKEIDKVDILTAIRWANEEWEKCLSLTIYDYFKHFFKQDDSEEHNSIRNADEFSLVQIERDALEKGVKYIKVGLNKLLKPISEDDVVEYLTIESLGDFVAKRNEDLEVAQ